MTLATRMNQAIDYGRKLKDADSFAQAMQELDINAFLDDRKNVFGITSDKARQKWIQQLELLRDPNMLSQVDPGDLRNMIVDHVEVYERNATK